jgi:hypothetical protein
MVENQNFVAVEQPTEIVEFSNTARGLAELRGRLAGVVYDVKTTAGMDSAKKDRRELVSLRTGLEEIRIEQKRVILARGKLLDAEAGRITAEILELEKPIDAQIKARETEQAAAKAERERIEIARVGALTKRVDWIRAQVVAMVGKPSSEVASMIATLTTMPLDAEHFAEKLEEATKVRAEVLEKLETLRAGAVANEAEAARLAEDRRIFEEEKVASARANAAEDKRRREARDAEEAAHRERQAAAEKRDAEIRDNLSKLAATSQQAIFLLPIAAFDSLLDCVAQWPITVELFGDNLAHALDVQSGALAKIRELRAARIIKLAEEEAAALAAAEAQRNRDALEQAADPWSALESIQTLAANSARLTIDDDRSLLNEYAATIADIIGIIQRVMTARDELKKV